MLSWREFLVQEGLDADSLGLNPKKLERDEEQYKRYKKQVMGQYVTPSEKHLQYLKSHNTWSFRQKIEDPSLSKGQAILKAKQKLYSPDGLGDAFDTSKFEFLGADAKQIENGWEVILRFKASRQMPSEGEELTAQVDELSKKGFRRTFKNRVTVSSIEPTSSIDSEEYKKLARKILESTFKQLLPSLENVLSGIRVDGRKSMAIFDPKTKQWDVVLQIEGLPTGSNDSIEKLGFTSI